MIAPTTNTLNHTVSRLVFYKAFHQVINKLLPFTHTHTHTHSHTAFRQTYGTVCSNKIKCACRQRRVLEVNHKRKEKKQWRWGLHVRWKQSNNNNNKKKQLMKISTYPENEVEEEHQILEAAETTACHVALLEL